MPCLFESEQVSVSVRDISLPHQNCRAEFCSPHENMPCWFHLISDHRLCSPVIIRKYLFRTFCARNVILWLKENHACNVETAALKKTRHFWKMQSGSLTLEASVFVFSFSMSNQLVSPALVNSQTIKQLTYNIFKTKCEWATTTTKTKPSPSQAGGHKWVQIMTKHHPETAVGEWWERKGDWQGSVCGVLFKAGEEEPVKVPATGEKGASHGPLCYMLQPLDPSVQLQPSALPWYILITSTCWLPLWKILFVCVPLRFL